MFLENYSKPTNLDDAYKLLQEDNNHIIGGGAWLKLQKSSIDTIIDISGLGLNGISSTDNIIEIGSMTTLRDIETNDIIKDLYDGILSKAVKSIMGVNVRNIATIGGSIMGKFSFSDIFTPLLVMDTRLVFYKTGEVCLEDFLDDKKFPKDILLSIRIKKSKGKGYVKTIKKTALDFPVLNIAITKSDVVKIAIGARPGRSMRAFNTEKEINNNNNIEQITNTILNEISLSSNFRASKEYRELLLKTYIKRGLKEVLHNER